MENYMPEYCAIEHEYNLAIAEFESFLEFVGTFEGDEIPDDLYSVATEIFGGDLAKSALAGIVKLAKKIWDLIVRLATWLADVIARVFKRILLDTKQLEKLYKALAVDTEQYNHNLKTLTRFAPKKAEFIRAMENLAVLYGYNHSLVSIIAGQDTDLREFNSSIFNLHCAIKSMKQVKTGSDGTTVVGDDEEMKLIIKDIINNNDVTWDRAVYLKVLTHALGIGNNPDADAWTTSDLRAAISAVLNANRAGIKANSMNVIANAKQAAKGWLDAVENPRDDMTQDDMDMARKLSIYAKDMVTLVANIYQLELTTTMVCTNVVSRMGAYAISPGALDLEDVSMTTKGANTGQRNPLIGLSVIGRM